MRKAVFLDRDGVINEIIVENGKARSPLSLTELKIFPWVAEAVRILKSAGYLCVVVTNKPDLATGKLTLQEMNAMHDFMKQMTSLEILYYCSHVDSDGCYCRKPLPGMILQAVKDHDVDLSKSYVIGDRWRDIEMGLVVGCQTVLVLSPETPVDHKQINYHVCVPDLLTAARWISQQV